MATRAAGRLVRYAAGPALLVVAVMAVPLIWRVSTPPDGVSAPGMMPAPPRARERRETRPTLDPALFVGKAALAHRVAREIPDTLDQLYCYCGCDKSAGHKSLLSCYTDGHAPT